MLKVTTKRLSICECGFPVLAEVIPVGTEYRILPEMTLDTMTFICGGCRKVSKVRAVWALPRGESDAGWLPMEIFR